MDEFDLGNPVFSAYLIVVALTVLKVMGQGWMTVHRMLKVNAGWASPEDMRKGMINKEPREGQLDPNDYVDRSRRMHRNDLENIPAFWAIGLAYVAIGPAPWLAYVMFYGFVLARSAHAVAYGTARSHETRATFYTIGSLIVVFMALHVLVALLF